MIITLVLKLELPLIL